MATPQGNEPRHPALTRPLDQLAWSDDARPYDRRERKRFRNAVAATLGLSATVAGCLALPSADAARLAGPECYTHEVARGDTLSSIARNYDTTVDALKAMNPQLAAPSFNLIYPGDQVAIVCLGDAQPPARDANPGHPEWDSIRSQPFFSCTVAGKQWQHCVSTERLIVAAHDVGWRGDDLVIMVATTFGEGAPAVDAVGDEGITNGTYGPSYGVVQVRSMWAMDHSGAPRDRFALWNPADPNGSLLHQMWAAREVWLEAGRSWSPWTNHRNMGHAPHLARISGLAAEIGAL